MSVKINCRMAVAINNNNNNNNNSIIIHPYSAMNRFMRKQFCVCRIITVDNRACLFQSPFLIALLLTVERQFGVQYSYSSHKYRSNCAGDGRRSERSETCVTRMHHAFNFTGDANPTISRARTRARYKSPPGGGRSNRYTIRL